MARIQPGAVHGSGQDKLGGRKLKPQKANEENSLRTAAVKATKTLFINNYNLLKISAVNQAHDHFDDGLLILRPTLGNQQR
jgi:hypothetical protein